jgi:hypothetical protein
MVLNGTGLSESSRRRWSRDAERDLDLDRDTDTDLCAASVLDAGGGSAVRKNSQSSRNE